MGLTAGGLVSAQEADIERCASLESDAERLACFDAVMQQRAQGTTPEAPREPPESPEPPPAAAPAASTPAGPAAAPPVEAPSAAAESASAATAAAPASTPAASGATADTEYRLMTKEEKKAARRAEKEAEKANREYTAVVTAMRKRPHGQVVVTLDNGEVWSEQYASRGFLVRVGDTVTMKKSRFSSAYRLVDKNGKGYAVTRLE